MIMEKNKFVPNELLGTLHNTYILVMLKVLLSM